MKLFSSRYNTVSPKLQIILDVATTVFTLSVMYYAFLIYSSTDVFPELIFLTPQEIVDRGGPGSPVNVGLSIKSFSEFDMVKGVFTASLSIWFRFDPHQVTIEQIDKFIFEDAVIKSKKKSMMKIEDRTLVVYYDMDVSFYLTLSYKKFPHDNHRLFLVLNNDFLDVSQAFFTSSYADVVVNPEIFFRSWSLYDKGVKPGFIFSESDQEYHPRIAFYGDFIQTDYCYGVIILVPILFIFFMALFSFSFEIDPAVSPFAVKPFSLALATAFCVLALVAYRFVIVTFSQGGMYLDNIFLYLFIGIAIICGINALGQRVTGSLKTYITFLFHIGINVFFYALFIL